MIEAVFLDIGETVLDRTREYAAWAREIGVPAHTFSAVFGAVIASGGTVEDVLGRFLPAEAGTGLRSRVAERVPVLAEQDLYRDARATLHQLRARGVYLGLAGNQPRHIGQQLRALALPVDVVAVSAEIGAAKPDPAFFAALSRLAGREAGSIAYVGDQLDNDVRAALDCGLQAVRVLTGPWGHLLRDRAVEARCIGVIPELAALPALLAPLLA